MKKVSIIIPAYNVSVYLEPCVQSILCQSYTNVEVVLVDDGSKDVTPEICDHLATLDDRILVFHKDNGGVSSARNLGIRQASGDYIMFVDGDDWLENDCIENMVKRIDETNTDACYCNRYFKDENNIHTATTLFSSQSIPTKDVICRHLRYGFISSPCLSLMKSKCVQNVFFNETIHTLEDWEYNFRCLAAMETISVLDRAYYHYRTVGGSASASPLNARKLTCLKIAQYVNEYIRDNNLPLKEEAKYVPVFLAYHMLVCYSGHGAIDGCELQVQNYACKTLFNVIFSPSVDLKHKSYLLLASIHPILFKIFYRAKNRR